MVEENLTAQVALKERKEKILKERKRVWLGAYNAAIASSASYGTVDSARHRSRAWANAALADFDEKFYGE